MGSEGSVWVWLILWNQMQMNTIERRWSPYRYEKPGRPKATIRINRFWVTLMGGEMETPSARPVSKDKKKKKNGGGR